MSDTAIEAGRSAWQRLLDHDRKSWDDWRAVGRALVIGRAEAMTKAKANRPLGRRYNQFIGQWLKQHGLDGIDNQQRYRAILCIEKEAEIERFRDGLAEAKRRRLNHPGAAWHAWRRSTKPETERSAPAPCNFVKISMASYPRGKPIFWPQSSIRAAHQAMLNSHSHDLLVLARIALEAAIPTQHVLIELLSPTTGGMSAPRADVASAAGHAR